MVADLIRSNRMIGFRLFRAEENRIRWANRERFTSARPAAYRNLSVPDLFFAAHRADSRAGCRPGG